MANRIAAAAERDRSGRRNFRSDYSWNHIRWTGCLMALALLSFANAPRVLLESDYFLRGGAYFAHLRASEVSLIAMYRAMNEFNPTLTIRDHIHWTVM